MLHFNILVVFFHLNFLGNSPYLPLFTPYFCLKCPLFRPLFICLGPLWKCGQYGLCNIVYFMVGSCQTPMKAPRLCKVYFYKDDRVSKLLTKVSVKQPLASHRSRHVTSRHVTSRHVTSRVTLTFSTMSSVTCSSVPGISSNLGSTSSSSG